ncbi:MAG: CoA transferase [Gordonibacter sp.]|uniref:CoA transferase n=1 Tax=Gordonibacter sp. TaxID=1968902 RepID=UPI002FCC8CB8
MTRRNEIPEFGVLSGLNVVVSAISTAGPFVGELFAEAGANVIWMESPKSVDPVRTVNRGWGIETERRNMRTISLDVIQPEGREIFLKFIDEADIFVESSRGQQWTEWGYPDELLWELNPKLVIAHMSGYGQSGVPEYVMRGGYDNIIQAYSCMMAINGFPDRDPILCQKMVTDYYQAFLTYGSALAAYVHALKTGEGESIDLAQYETSIRCQNSLPTYYFQEGLQEPRSGSRSNMGCGTGYFTCGDGNGIYTIVIGQANVRKFVKFLGLEYGSELFPEGMTLPVRGTKAGEVFEKTLMEYLSTKTAIEAEQELLGAGLNCSRVLDYAAAAEDPQYIARDTFIEWENINGEKVKGVNSFPKFKRNPSQIWCPAPTVGLDNEDILADFGYEDEGFIKSLYDNGVIRKSDFLRK